MYVQYVALSGFCSAGFVQAWATPSSLRTSQINVKAKQRRVNSPRRMGGRAAPHAMTRPERAQPLRNQPRLHLVVAGDVTTSLLVPHRHVRSRRTHASRPQPTGSTEMKNHVYKILEIVGSSQTGIEDAIGTAIELAGKTVRNMDWFEVVETRGHIKDGKIGHYQVTLKIGFTLETQ
jgi:flavin-binding protein dodecin